MRRVKVLKRLLEWLMKAYYSTVTEQIFKPMTYPNVSLCM